MDAFHKALDLLSRRDHLTAELVEKLRRRDYAVEEIDEAVRRCRELGYLDDSRVARRFVEVWAAKKGWGPHRLRAELLRRGAPPGIASEVSRLTPEMEAAALHMALRRAELGQPEGWWRLHEGRGRVISSLVKRGFHTEAAVREVDELARQRENENHASHEQRGDPPELS